MANSTATRAQRKSLTAEIRRKIPRKDRKKIELTPHRSGKWYKWIAGNARYFGRWGHVVNGKMEILPDAGWKDAHDQYERERGDYEAGRVPRAKSSGPASVGKICNRFLDQKRKQLEAGKLTHRSFQELDKTCDRLTEIFGERRLVEELTPEDFNRYLAKMAERWGPVRLGNEVVRVRSVFQRALQYKWLREPVDFGPDFKKPPVKEIRIAKHKRGRNVLTAGECRTLIDAAGAPLRAMVLLGLNCAFGPMDCATLSFEYIDLKGGWIDYFRPKTGVDRRCKLWPETIEALNEAIAARPTPKDEANAELVFITSRGNSWISSHAAHPITVAVVRLMKAAGVHRKGLGPYTMRHVFRTEADPTLDRPAIDWIMGHSDPSQAGRYREYVADSRLERVANHVRSWLGLAGNEQREAPGGVA